MMEPPRVLRVEALDDHTLLVEFTNRVRKTYDVGPLMELDLFAPLKTPALFKAVEVDKGGYAVIWGDSIDISEHELWRNGRAIAR